MHKKVKDGVGYQSTAEGTRPEVLPPLSWRSPESSGYFHISDFQHHCTRVNLCRAKSTKTSVAEMKTRKWQRKIRDWKRTCCWLVFFWRITPIFLSRFCRRGLRLLSAFSSCWSTRVIKFFLRSLIIILRRIVNVKNLFWVEHQRQPVDVDRVRDNVIVLACKRPLKVQQEES